jgi:DNA-binding NtrC family response regulator
MPNDRLSEPQHPRIRTDFQEARLRLPAPVYLGHSSATRQVQGQIHRALSSRSPVLVSGAPGTGKRTIAEILHHFGGSEGPLEQVAIEDGRVVGRLGQFAYVCPVERLSLEQQVQLVEAAELAELAGSGRLVLGTRLRLEGDASHRRLDPRLLLACPIRIELPTLRDRIEDLELLALRILWSSPSHRPIGGIDDYALDCLRAHAWPGNVSELEEVMRAAIEIGSGEQIELRDLPPGLRLRAVELPDFGAPDFDFSLAHAERSAIERAVRYARGNKRKAARLLRISKTTVYRKLQWYDAVDDQAVDGEE